MLRPLRHIRVGYAERDQPLSLLIAADNVRVLAKDGSLMSELTLDSTRDYQPLGTPDGRRPAGYYLRAYAARNASTPASAMAFSLPGGN